MALVMIAAPAAEPIGLAEAKAHLRVDADDEDALIAALITTARMFVERTLALALITQDWSLLLDAWPTCGFVLLPLTPVQAVTAISVHAPDGGSATVDAADYAVDVLSEPARILLRNASLHMLPARPLNAVEIAFTAGYGDGPDDVPAPIRHALTLLVAHWFERREPVVLGFAPQEVPATVAGLLLPYRRVRL
jgi:uncharacterized phiE125 gp8 family phage protein